VLNPFFYYQAIMLALGQIWVNKTRSFLTTLAIIIGVVAVTIVIAGLDAMKTKILTDFEMFGANKMFIFPHWPDDAPRNKYSWTDIRLKRTELEALTEHCPSIRRLSPTTDFNAVIQNEDEIREGVQVVGIWPQWHDIERRQVLMGRPFVPSDEENAHQVCLVNEAAIEELELPVDPTGHTMLVDGRRFLVIGVVETLQAAIFGQGETSAEVFIPFSTAVKFKSPWFFFMITCQVVSPEAAEEAKAEARFVLRNIRKLEPDESDTFQIEAIDQYIEVFRNIATVITAVAGGVVGVALLVGGIGIMNIMLVSVSERTREIGLRKAVGATPAAVLLQFLLEAITLCLFGGFIGLAIGEAITFLCRRTLADYALDQMTIPLWAIVMACGFSAGVGIIFGMFPAIKAARLDPIEALRHE